MFMYVLDVSHCMKSRYLCNGKRCFQFKFLSVLRAEMGTCPGTLFCIFVSPCRSWFTADAFANGWAGTSSFDFRYVSMPEYLFLLCQCW